MKPKAEKRVLLLDADHDGVVTAAEIDAFFNKQIEGRKARILSHLDADKEAIAGMDSYDDDYFEKFFARVKPMLEMSIADAIAATASVIVGAWEAAGKPALKTEMPHTVQKVKK